MEIQVGDVLEVGICRDEPQMILQGVGGDPVIGVGQSDAPFFQVGTDAGVDERCHFVRVQALEVREKFLRFEERVGCCPCEKLAVEKFADDVAAQQGRIVADGECLHLTVATPQQLRRTCIKQNGHGWRLPGGWSGGSSE